MKLISMTYFVMKQWEGVGDFYPFKEMCVKLYDYAKFLKQPLELWMFVPCDKNENVLETPKMFYSKKDIKNLKGIEIDIATSVNNKAIEYQQAKERCLFKGFILDESGFLRNNTGKIHVYKNFLKDKTIEDLIKYDLELTPTALKRIE